MGIPVEFFVQDIKSKIIRLGAEGQRRNNKAKKGGIKRKKVAKNRKVFLEQRKTK